MPWGRLDDSLYDHRKLEQLGDDRLTGVGLWAVAISWCNRHLTDGHVPARQIDRLGGTTELADRLVDVALFDHAADGGYLVHDFLEFNDSKADVLARRAREAQRKAEYRRSKGATADVSQRDTEPVPAGQRPKSRTVSQRDSQMSQRDTPPKMSRRDTRAHPHASAPDAPDANPDPNPTRPDPTESLSRENGRATNERADVEALLDRGWKRVTKAQIAVLDEVADRHDVTGYGFAAEAIRNTPDDGDPLAAVMDADRLWQRSRRDQVDELDDEWAKTKATERAEAGDAMTRIGEGLEAWVP